MLLFIGHNKKGRAKMARFLYSAFSDEAADSIDGQIAACKANGVTHMELRGVDGKNISEFTVDEAKALKEKLDANGMKVSSIGSYYGKIEITDDFEPHFEGFKNTVEVAKILEAKYIRLFSFYFTKGESYEEYRPEVMRRVRAMAEYSKERGVLCPRDVSISTRSSAMSSAEFSTPRTIFSTALTFSPHMSCSSPTSPICM